MKVNSHATIPVLAIVFRLCRIGLVDAAMLSPSWRRFALPSFSRYSVASTICRASHSLSRLNSVTAQDVDHFAKILSPTSILSTLAPFSLAATELDIYNNDWMGKYHGNATTVLKPKTTQEVSDIVKWCHEKRIGIVPQGGNTGLVGGSVPVNDEVVISLANMNQVRSFDPISGS